MNKLVLFVLIGFLTISTEAKMQTSELEITLMKIITSNQSMGPHNKVRTWSLNSQDAEFKKLSQKVLTEAKVNGKYSFLEFFNDEQDIEPAKPNILKQQKSGAGSTKITIHFNNSKSITLDEDHDYFITSPFNELVSLTKKNGSYSEFKPSDPSLDPGPQETPEAISTKKLKK